MAWHGRAAPNFFRTTASSHHHPHHLPPTTPQQPPTHQNPEQQQQQQLQRPSPPSRGWPCQPARRVGGYVGGWAVASASPGPPSLGLSACDCCRIGGFVGVPGHFACGESSLSADPLGDAHPGVLGRAPLRRVHLATNRVHQGSGLMLRACIWWWPLRESGLAGGS